MTQSKPYFLYVLVTLLQYHVSFTSSKCWNKSSTVLLNMSSKNKAVISGAGPSGLATALILKKAGWKYITIYEKRSADYFETESAYTYLLDGRGQKLTNLLKLTYAAAERGVDISSVKKDTYSTIIKADGSIHKGYFPKTESQVGKYMIPRARLLEIFLNEIDAINSSIHEDDEKINIIFNSSTKHISINDNNRVIITIESYDSISQQMKTIITYADLLIGCDGIHSVVRSYMIQSNSTTTNSNKNTSMASNNDVQEGGNEPAISSSSKLTSSPMITYLKSPAVGLKFKMLRINAPFLLPNKNISSIYEQMYVIESKTKKSDEKIRIGLFPIKMNTTSGYTKYNLSFPRVCANVNLPYHKLWSLSTFEEHKAFFQKSYPQFPNISTLISDEEIKRFSTASIGTFPYIQYMNNFYIFANHTSNTSSITTTTTSENSVSMTSSSAILVLGDAAHSFPPDFGAGVNSAFEDVYALYQVLVTYENNLSQALPVYQSIRYPEVKAMCELLQYGFPYQYRQHIILYNIYIFNFIFRKFLHRIAPHYFSEAVFLMIQNHEVSYVEVQRLSERTTRNVIILSIIIVCILILIIYMIIKRCISKKVSNKVKDD